jgi:hypothetical protein
MNICYLEVIQPFFGRKTMDQPLGITVTRTPLADEDEVIINLTAPDGTDIQAARHLLKEAARLAEGDFAFTDEKHIYDGTLPSFTRPGTWSSLSSPIKTPTDIARYTAESILLEVNYARRRAFKQYPINLPYRENAQDLVRDAEAALLAFETEREGAQVDGRWAAHLAREEAFRRAQVAAAASRVAEKRKAVAALQPSVWTKLKNFITNN